MLKEVIRYDVIEILTILKGQEMKKTIVIFANSIKHQKHCVAGKCILTKQWVRPVSNIQGRELTSQQTTYVNKYGTYLVKPKQKIEMNFNSHAPILHQPENYLIDNSPWQQRYKIEDSEVNQYLDAPTSLWGTTNKVEYSRINSKMIVIPQSLYLIQTKGLTLYKTKEDKRRASFNYNSIAYDFPVTDPNFDKIRTEGMNTFGILCISLGENFNGYCYKIVATIF
ncbi:MAG: Unknown protein [uncultured Sulfurovum sp.]|uniref:Dual OB-containing domain-containing protein n=1 Tax=uncultured Sulfurovum sp. TaxID=269237 RepID=A0A6S6S9S6_9BACT|nr:MAG: Unknown protein [uncultured Sulfurovum sp.]